MQRLNSSFTSFVVLDQGIFVDGPTTLVNFIDWVGA